MRQAAYKRVSRATASIIDFDFNVGTLQQSPCRNCANRAKLPCCRKTCKLLDRIQGALINKISCGRDVAPDEGFRLILPN